jgi:hypothetical protein
MDLIDLLILGRGDPAACYVGTVRPLPPGVPNAVLLYVTERPP